MIAFLIDADNLSAPAWVDEAFQTIERTEGAIAIRRAYGSPENLKGLADTLRVWAVRPFVRESKCVTLVTVNVLLGGYRALSGLFWSGITMAVV